MTGVTRGLEGRWAFFDIEFAHLEYHSDGLRLSEVVSDAFATWAPYDFEVFEAYAVADPVIAHVHRLGTTLFACLSGDSFGCHVVGSDGRGRLDAVQIE